MQVRGAVRESERVGALVGGSSLRSGDPREKPFLRDPIRVQGEPAGQFACGITFDPLQTRIERELGKRSPVDQARMTVDAHEHREPLRKRALKGRRGRARTVVPERLIVVRCVDDRIVGG